MVSYLFKLNRGKNKLSKKLEKGLNVFSATWCTPCKMSKALLDAQEVNYQALDMDEDSELFAEFNVRSIPTFVFADDSGNVVNTVIGGIKPSDINEWQIQGLINE